MNLPDELHRDGLPWDTGFSHREWHLPCLAGFGVSARGIYLVNPIPLQMCNFCHKKGATVGCEERRCRRSYHFFCALCDDAAVETDQVKGVYRYSPSARPGVGLPWVGPKGSRREGNEFSSPKAMLHPLVTNCGRNVVISQESFIAVGGNLFSA